MHGAHRTGSMNGYQALRTQAAYFVLSGRGLLKLTGEDCARLLHAMSTNHVNGLAAGQGLLAFFLSAQGRILADANIYNLGESFWLDTEPELGPKLRDHLDRFIIADDVTIDDESSAYVAVGLEGPEWAQTAVQLGIPVPSLPLGTLEWRSVFVSRAAATAADGLRIFMPVAEQESLISSLQAAGVPLATTEEAEVVRVENGIPRYGQDISERYLVQETGLLSAMHSNKGCYVGQEIVERVRSRGQVHRHLSRIQIESKTVPSIGGKVLLDGKEVGEITSAAYSPTLGKVAGLAYLRTEALDANRELHLAQGGAAVTVSR